MSRIEAITNRFTGLSMRSGGQQQQNARDAKLSNSPRSPRNSTHSNTEYQNKVDCMLRNPKLFSEFKRRVSETKNFSNAGANFVLHDFLEELELPGNSIDVDNPNNNNGFNNGFGLLNSLRTMTLEPPSPDASYQSIPRSRFACPESPGSVQNLSPTHTPLTPISATSASTTSSTPTRSPDDVAMMAAEKKKARSRGAMLAGLEQPSLL